jgi:cyclohexa-1,5-dienecarbonyl-CoA hydratase
MPHVSLTVADGLARVVMDRPPVNVIDLAMAAELADTLEQVSRRPEVAVVVLEARGRAFCAGVDVRDHLPDRGASMLREFDRACVRLFEMEVPTIAAVQGAALGGGCELTLVCDLVVASSEASFAQPEIKLAVFPPLAAVMLPRLVPPHIAAEMVLTGRRLSADEARQYGLANHVVTPAEFEAAVNGLVSQLLAMSPASLRLTKRAMRLARCRADAAEIEAAERFYVEHLLHSADAIEGLKAFMEKRAPAWTKPAG